METIVESARGRCRDSRREADAARLPHLGLDAMFGFELRQELIGVEGFAQDLDGQEDGLDMFEKEILPHFA